MANEDLLYGKHLDRCLHFVLKYSLFKLKSSVSVFYFYKNNTDSKLGKEKKKGKGRGGQGRSKQEDVYPPLPQTAPQTSRCLSPSGRLFALLFFLLYILPTCTWIEITIHILLCNLLFSLKNHEYISMRVHIDFCFVIKWFMCVTVFIKRSGDYKGDSKKRKKEDRNTEC